MLRQARLLGPGVLALALWCGPAPSLAQGLTDSGQELPGVWAGAASWADRDGDGDPDLALIGEVLDDAGTPHRAARLFDNTGGVLAPNEAAGAQLTGVEYGDAAWADYDGDGDLDVAIAGDDSTGQESLRLYTNRAGVLTYDATQLDDDGLDILRGVRYATVSWADYDGDGDLDLLVAGMDRNGVSLTALYTNTDGRFRRDAVNNASLVSVHDGDLAWADYDGDGDLDVAVSGVNVTNNGGLRSVTEIYRNHPVGTLSLDATANLGDRVHGGSLAWADYDGDGAPDLAVSGTDDYWNTATALFRNRPPGFFTATALALAPAWRLGGELAWADFDADGDPDLAVAGRTATSTYRVGVLANTAGSFAVAWSDTQTAALAGGSLTWTDYDLDGRPDLTVTGVDAAGVRRTRLLHNNNSAANQPPDPPASLNPAVASSRRLQFSWTPAVDDHGANLSYNLRVGTTSGGNDIVSGAAVPGAGNAGAKNLRALTRSLPRDTYYWSVQAIDAAGNHSAWSQEAIINLEQFAASDLVLRDLSEVAMAWGDYDGDGDPDLVLAGLNRSGEAQSLLYVNEDSTLSVVPDAGLAALRNGDVAWGDYDGDGDLDLLLTGEDTFQNPRTVLYAAQPRGNRTALVAVGRFPDLRRSDAEWGDFDNDGDLDLALMGQTDIITDGVQQSRTYVFANDGHGSFTDTQAGLPGLNNGELAAADIDGDGDLDLAVTGSTNAGERRLEVYTNDGGRFTEAGMGLDGLESSDLAWADYDGDGDPDLVATGIGAGGLRTTLYRNDGGRLTAVSGLDLPGVRGGDLAWGDYDNDRDLDLVIAGNDGTQPILAVFRNQNGILTADPIRLLTGVDFSAVAWADYDGDGDLDLTSAGHAYVDFQDVVRSTVNDNLEGRFNPNRAPGAPTGLTAVDSAATVTLSWLAGTDDGEESPASLTYNLKVGTVPGGHDVLSGATAVGRGNAGWLRQHRLQGLASGTYYASVQTVDDGWRASAWSPVQRFIIDTVPPAVATCQVSPARLGIGQTVTATLTLIDEHAGVDVQAVPKVVAVLSGQEFAFTTLQYTGSSWTGSLVVGRDMPTGVADVLVQGVADAKGNLLTPYRLGEAFAVDTAPPGVVSSVPADGQAEVSVDQEEIAIAFSEALAAGVVSSHTFELELGNQILENVPAPQYDAATYTVRFRPLAGILQAGSEYRVEISPSIEDLAGNRPTVALSVGFSTRVPHLIATVPAAGDTLVEAGSTALIARFDAPLLTTDLDDVDVIRVTRDGQAAALRGPPVYDATAHTLTFELARGLQPGSRYAVVMAGALGGPLGVQQQGDFTWQFATAAPTLTRWEPADTAAVAVQRLAATFSGVIDASLLSAATVQVTREGDAQVITGLSYDADTHTIGFGLEKALRPGSRYEVTLAGLLAGPRRAGAEGSFGWVFTTPVPDLVEVSPPADRDDVVPADAVVAAIFDHSLDTQALQGPGAVRLLAGGTDAELAEIGYNPDTRTVRLTPAGGLRAGSAYEVRIAGAVGGPQRDRDYTWRFRTAVPRRLAASPAPGAEEVAADLAEALLQLSLPVDADLAVPAHFQLLREGQPVALRPSDPDYRGDGLYALAPAAGWQVGSHYNIQVAPLVAGPLAGEQALGWSFVTAVPRLVTAEPSDSTVGSDGTFRASFSAPIDAGLLSAATVRVIREGQLQTLNRISTDAQARVVSFDLVEGLRPGSRYQVSLSGLLGGPVRQVAEGDFTWSFATPVPQVLSQTPAAEQDEVDVATRAITVSFDRAVDAAALADAGVLVLTAGGVEVPTGSVDYLSDSHTLRLNVPNGLRAGTAYQVRAAAALGGPLQGSDYTWRFRTAVPRLVTVVPDRDAVDVGVDLAAASVTFSSVLDADLATSSQFAILREGVPMPLRPGDPTPRGNGLYELAPAAGWQVGSSYRIQINAGVTGPLGSSEPLTWAFATARPEIVSVSPAAGDTEVTDLATTVRVRFNAPIDAALLSDAGQVQWVENGASAAIGGLAYDAPTRTLSFTPVSGLRPGTAYQVRLAAALGGPLQQVQGDYQWRFATAVPRPVSWTPTTDASVSAGSMRVQVRFSGPVDRLLLTPANLRLNAGGAAVTLDPLGFSYDENTATVSFPAVALVAGTRYTASVSARLRGPQAAGQADLDWSFRTAQPEVRATVPAAEEDGVSVSLPALQIAFSGAVAREDADAFQVEARSLADTSAWTLVPVSSPTGRDSSGVRLLNFSLSGGLRAATEYRVTVQPAVFGPLATSGHSWVFRTAAALASAATGGSIANADSSVALYFPPQALSVSGAEIVIRRLAEADTPAKPAVGPTRVGSAYQISAGGAGLRKPVTLTMRWTAAELGRSSATRLAVFRRGAAAWERLGGAVDTMGLTVRTAVTELGTFALFEDLDTPVGAVAIEDLDCQPRAFSPTGSQGRPETDISFLLTHPADVTVRVYDLTGRLTRVIAAAQPMAPGRVSLPWDGRDEDRGQVPSGLYIVVVNSGSAQREKTVAVVR